MLFTGSVEGKSHQWFKSLAKISSASFPATYRAQYRIFRFLRDTVEAERELAGHLFTRRTRRREKHIFANRTQGITPGISVSAFIRGPNIMKITDIRATTVTVPLEAPLRHANGCHWGRFVRTIVEVETDNGLIGLGEMGGGGESAEAVVPRA